MIWQWLFFHGLIITSSAFPCVEMVCNVRDLQGLCPSDNKSRLCTCVVTTGDRLIWSTTLQPGVCSPAPSISFSSTDPVEHSSAAMGFTANLTNNTEGQLTSILIFTPSAVLASGIKSVHCNNGNIVDCNEPGKTLTVTYSVSPKTRQFTSFSVTCDTSNGTYRASITFNDDETGGSDIQYYNGTVTGPSGFSSQFNVTNNTVVIPGLQCSTSYNINVTAVNCAGVSTVTATCFTTPQPDLSSFTITSACLDSSSKIRVEWMPPIITSCHSITGYLLSVVNNISQQVSFGTVGEGTSLSISVSNVSTYYNITIYVITDYRTITTTSNGSFTLWSDNKSMSLITSSTTLCLIPNQLCVLPCPLGYGPNSACTGCVPVHICVTDNPCENGGTCNIGTNNNTDYTCSCAPNFSGTNCTMCVLPCPLGYGPNSACNGCVPVHICVTDNPCQNGGTCNIGTNNNTDYTCSCAPNFSGKNCTGCVLPCPLGYEPNSVCNGCIPVHICVTNNPCQNGGTCTIGTNNNTDYTCSCAQNLLGENCSDPVHICVTNNPCKNGGTCNIGSSSISYTCSCLPNYSGQTCEVLRPWWQVPSITIGAILGFILLIVIIFIFIALLLYKILLLPRND